MDRKMRALVQADLDKNPIIAELGGQVGDSIMFSAPEPVPTPVDTVPDSNQG